MWFLYKTPVFIPRAWTKTEISDLLPHLVHIVIEWPLLPYPCSHFYFDINFGDILYLKEKRPGSPLLIWIQSVAKFDIKVKVTTWIGHLCDFSATGYDNLGSKNRTSGINYYGNECTTYSNQLDDNFYCSANCNSATQYFAYAVKSKQNLNFWIFQQRNIWEFRGKNTTALGIRRADALHHYNVCHHYRVPQNLDPNTGTPPLTRFSNNTVF